MNAVVLLANGRLERRDWPVAPLQPDECRVAIRTAGICSSDVPRAFAAGAYRYPLVMGHELAGEILECGRDAATFTPGDRVVVFPLLPCFACDACAEEAYVRCRAYDYYGSRRDGGFAETLNVRAWNLLPVPTSVSFEDAALVEPVAVVYHALARGRADAVPAGGAGVAVLGAGFLGLIAVDLLRRLRPDLAVTVVDRNGFKLDVAAAAGAHTVAVPDEVAWQQFIEAHRGRFDLVLEASGAPTMFVAATEIARAGHAVVWMGNISGDLTIPKALVSAILRRELTIVGTWNSSYRGTAESDWTHVRALLIEGWKPSHYVTHRIDLAALPDTLARMDAHRIGRERQLIIKVVVTTPEGRG